MLTECAKCRFWLCCWRGCGARCITLDFTERKWGSSVWNFHYIPACVSSLWFSSNTLQNKVPRCRQLSGLFVGLFSVLKIIKLSCTESKNKNKKLHFNAFYHLYKQDSLIPSSEDSQLSFGINLKHRHKLTRVFITSQNQIVVPLYESFVHSDVRWVVCHITTTNRF